MSEFIFNERTGELERGGKLIALSKLHSEMFACLAAAQAPITVNAMAMALNIPAGSITYEMPAFRGRLARVHIRVASQGGRGGKGGYWLQLEEIPKWAPTTKPPAEVPFQ